MSLRVYGVVMHDGHGPATTVPAGCSLFPLRELASVAEEGDFKVHDVDVSDIERHIEVVGALFRQDAVLPAPVGTVFRSAEVLQRWMELHYVALSDALAWVEDRLAARVHITRASGRPSDKEAGSDLAAIAAEVTRSLRRHAVASVPLRNEEVTGIVLSASYLVERDLWEEFKDAVESESERHPLVKMQLTGPWPAHDFVRLQFGA
ncbi:MAG: GvpL/GvpF family gas vesicle protein [Gemmatimonadaceae bacterium]